MDINKRAYVYNLLLLGIRIIYLRESFEEIGVRFSTMLSVVGVPRLLMLLLLLLPANQ